MNKFICSIVIVLLCFLNQNMFAKANNCDNLSFERGDFTNWTGKTWLHFYTEILNPSTGIEPGRHTIMSDTTAYDRNTGGKLKIVPAGYKHSARLGDAVNGCLSESLSYTLTVDSTNALFIWKFAVVLQDPLHDHMADEQPRFKITLEDQDGNIISSCSQYDVNAAEHIPGFQTYYPDGFSRDSDNVTMIVWRDWTTAAANLMPFYGKKVTLTFTSEDCTKQGHFGYAYFVAECHPMIISVNYCKDDTDARLEAPEGFSDYVWTPGNIKGRVLTVNNATLGNQYNCSFNSVMGCQVELSASIIRTTPNASFKCSLLDAQKRTYKFINTSTTNNGTISDFSWNFGDGTSSTELSPTHTYISSGIHHVTLEIVSSPSGCRSSQSMEIDDKESVPLSINGDPSFCHGQNATLTASGRIRYHWSTGETTPTVRISRSGSFFVVGWKENGSHDTAFVKVKEKTSPSVIIMGSKMLCHGYSTTLTAKGADTYNWNTNETSSSISVSAAGIYSVTGITTEGCKSEVVSTEVTQETEWKPVITGDSLFCANANTTLTASGATAYQWNNGSSSQTISINTEGTYIVTGTNKNGCKAQTSMHVSKIPLPEVNFRLTPDKLDLRNPVISGDIATKEEINYEWQLGDGTITNSPTFTHKYNVSNSGTGYTITLNAVDQYGCANSLTKNIILDLKVPNVFTPNNDGYNDTFMPNYDLQIYDRNGILIYNGNQGWNGTYKGAKMDPDAYFYLLRYVDTNNIAQIKKGCVMLVR